MQIALLRLPQYMRAFLTVFVLFSSWICQAWGAAQVQLPSCRGMQQRVSEGDFGCFISPHQCRRISSSYLRALAFCSKQPSYTQGWEQDLMELVPLLVAG